MAYREREQFDEAASQFQTLLDQNSHLDVVANNYAALIVERRFEYSAMLDKTLSLAKRFRGSNNPFFLDTLGWVHYRRGNVKHALKFLERAIQIGPNLRELRYHLGMAYHKNREFDRARQEFKQAVVNEANYPEAEETGKVSASSP